ncbi:hypothetical protein DL96DRAFT_1717537 [Flagelloscypha sp. PMI_526]|nr:hypothetical protein DL96DRAFT_1717537 [Flagelloscypha sp. PMI_526]
MSSSCKQPTPQAATSTIDDEIAAQMATLAELTCRKEEEEKQLELERAEEERARLAQEEEKKKKKKEKKSKAKQVEDPPAVESDSDNGGYATPGASTEVISYTGADRCERCQVGSTKDPAPRVCEVPIGRNLRACIRCGKQGRGCSFVKSSKDSRGAGATPGSKCKAGGGAKTTQVKRLCIHSPSPSPSESSYCFMDADFLMATHVQQADHAGRFNRLENDLFQLKQQHAELSRKHNDLLRVAENQGDMINALVKASERLEQCDRKVVRWQHGVDGFLRDEGVRVDIREREGGGLPIPEYFGRRTGQVHGVPESVGAGVNAGPSAGGEAKEKEGEELEDEGEAE